MNARQFCDWCGEPAVKGGELCAKCLEAQKQVEAGALVPVTPPVVPPKSQPVLVQVGNGLMFVAKGMAVLAISAAMFVLGLLGTCSSLALFGSLGNPGTFLFFLFFTAVFFGSVFGLFKCIQWMYKAPPKRINQVSSPVPRIPPPMLIDHTADDLDDDYFPLDAKHQTSPIPSEPVSPPESPAQSAQRTDTASSTDAPGEVPPDPSQPGPPKPDV